MKILLDMNIPIDYATLLIARNIETVRWSDVGAANALDAELIEYASKHDFIILTFDLDFGTILAATHKLKPSVIQIRTSILHAEQAVNLIATALFQNAEALEKGAIVSVNLKRAKLRLLPL